MGVNYTVETSDATYPVIVIFIAGVNFIDENLIAKSFSERTGEKVYGVKIVRSCHVSDKCAFEVAKAMGRCCYEM